MAISNDDVTAIIDTSRDVSPMLTTASLIVSEELSGSSLSTDRKDQITAYLAAHFVSISDQILARERMGESDDTYKQPSDFDQGLSATFFGQTAMLLDTTGKLAAMATNKGLKARFSLIADKSHNEYGKIPWSAEP